MFFQKLIRQAMQNVILGTGQLKRPYNKRHTKKNLLLSLNIITLLSKDFEKGFLWKLLHKKEYMSEGMKYYLGIGCIDVSLVAQLVFESNSTKNIFQVVTNINIFKLLFS